MRIVVKGHDLVAQIVYDAKEDAASSNNNVMGVDLGIKCPAVSYCPDGSGRWRIRWLSGGERAPRR